MNVEERMVMEAAMEKRPVTRRLSWPRFVDLVGDRDLARRIATRAGSRIPRPPADGMERRDELIRLRVVELIRSDMRTKDAENAVAREFGISLRSVERIRAGGGTFHMKRRDNAATVSLSSVGSKK